MSLDRPVNVVLPDLASMGLKRPELERAMAKYRHIEEERRQAGHRLDELQRKREQALAAARDDLAAALVAGKPDPGKGAVSSTTRSRICGPAGCRRGTGPSGWPGTSSSTSSSSYAPA